MKTLRKYIMLAMTIAVLVGCFAMSTMTAYASGYYECSRCGCDYSGYGVFGDGNGNCSRCGCPSSNHIYHDDTQSEPVHTHSWTNANPAVYRADPADANKEQRKQVCSTCGAEQWVYYSSHSYTNFNPMQYQKLDANNHQYKQYCSRCGTSVTRWVNAGHSWQYTDVYQQLSDTQHQRQQQCSLCGETKWVTQNCTWVNFNPMQYQQSTNSQHQYKQYCRYCDRTRWMNQNHSMVAQNNPKDGNGELAYRSIDSATQCERKWVCSTCGYTEWRVTNHSFAAADPWAAIDATQHQNRRTCNNCKCSVAYQTAKHSFTNQLVGGTDGHYTVQMCTACAYTGVEGDLDEHTYGNWSYTTSNGMKIGTRTCSKCKFMDQENEIIGPVQGLETATVLSDPMTLEQIRTNAGTNVTSPAWKAAIGSSSTFNSAQASTSNYAWTYNNVAYGLTKRADGLYFIVQLPSYYWTRVANKYPNGTPTYGGGGGGSTYAGTSTTTYDTTKNVSYGSISKDYAGSGSGNTNAAYNAMISVIKQAGGASSVKPGASSGGYTVATDSKGNVKYDSKGYPMMSKSEPVYVHSCSYSYSYRDVNDNVHEKTTTSCCGGSSKRMESHNYGTWTYTDLGPEMHRAERVCKNCGHVDVQYENHLDNDVDGRCDRCLRIISVLVTWRWYDEHTPVVDTTRQYYYRGLVTPPVRGRMDYKFTGWYTKWGGDENGGVLWEHGDNFPYGSPVELFASWKAIVELKFDLSAPIITVTREPDDPKSPTKGVTLTVTAVDPDGNDHELPLQIEGEKEWHASPWTFTVDDSKPITIVARDTENNTRQFVVMIQNVDVAPPVIQAITQDTTGWTNKPVTLTVLATDDQKLHATAYQWEYTPNSTGVATLGSWTATNTFKVAEAGKARVQVRDAVGNTTWSDYYFVNNIDTTAPGLDPSEPYTVSTADAVAPSTGVTITLNLWDTPDSVTNMSSGLAASPIKWVNQSDVYTTQRSMTVHSNGTYYVVLKDAVGNESAPIPITIGNISTNEPVIKDLYGTDVDGDRIVMPVGPDDWAKAPITITVDADFGDVGAPDKPYSWDGGQTWTSLNTFEVNTNGEYTVIIRDANGTQKEQSIILSNADDTDPVVGMYLYKGQPDDWTTRFPGKECTEADYVWKLRIEAEDVGGSGIDKFYTQWDGNKEHPASELPLIFDVPNPGTYQVKVYDKAGNSTTMEKVAQWTDLGESVDGPNPNVPISQPDVGGGGFGNSGSAGQPFDANLEDLVFGPEGAYNTKTGTYTPYPPNLKGIPVHFNAEITRNRYGTAEVLFNNTKYPAVWNGDYSSGKQVVLGTGDPIPGYAFIPIEDIKSDVKNARIRVTVREWDKCTNLDDRNTCSDLLKEGVENYYTSVQNSKPTLNYTYNRVTDTATITATSSIAGLKAIYYGFSNSEATAATGVDATTEYTGPFPLAGHEGQWLVMKAVDKLGITTIHYVAVDELAGGLLNGATPGAGSLPQESMTEGSGNNSYHSSNRAADIYIIGGTRGNTSQVPSGNVFNVLTGAAATP